MTAAVHIAKALAYQGQKDTVAPGEAQAALRRRIMADPAPSIPTIAADTLKRLMAVSIEDMPAPADDLALLIDTICMRHGLSSRAEAWRSVGINPNRGRELFARNAGAIDWPIWFTVRQAALG